MLTPTYKIPDLPLDIEIETAALLKKAAAAYREIGNLRREAARVPNQGILIDTLALQEAQASSEIESIVTTQDEIFQIGPTSSDKLEPAQKEVARYRDSLQRGYEGFLNAEGLITNNTIISIFQELKRTTGDYRAAPGTKLTNDYSKETVYVPPQSLLDIRRHMENLERFINEPSLSDLDPLIKMAVIHHQFESIHPFPDGNGRVGRILNVIYLVQQGILDIPILYLSRFITRTKPTYYGLLQSVRDDGNWNDWIDYILTSVQATAIETTELLRGINILLSQFKTEIREQHSKIYSHELLNNLFRHPYTRIDYLTAETGVGRQAASRHLDQLCGAGLLTKTRRGKHNYYINTKLVDLFINRPDILSLVDD